jgi:hypothetical protein
MILHPLLQINSYDKVCGEKSNHHTLFFVECM